MLESMAHSSANILPLVSQFMADSCQISSADTPLFVALSGGPDSVALLHILHTLGHSIIALHCNFHLRGAESDRDQKICEELCHRLNIELQVKHFDTFAYMKQRNLSLEMAARELRYQWWQELLTTGKHNTSLLTFNFIALGHHQDDSIETFLMNLMRGTGINGVTGIVPRNEATHVIRPLICLSRLQILDYLSSVGLDYITDSSNLENDTVRNQIRNQLLPLMEQILPQARHGISLTMQHLSEVANWYETEIQQYIKENARRVAIDSDNTYEMISRPMPHLIHPLTQFYQQHGFDVKISKDLFLATPKKTKIYDHPSNWSVTEIPVSEATLGRDSHTAYFDAALVTLPLTYRHWQLADRIAPLGMQGHTRLLSDVFSDHHLLPLQKQNAWIITDATGLILWVPGFVQSDNAKITLSTSKVLKVTI